MLEGEPIAQKKRPVPKRKHFRSVGPFSLIFGRKVKTDAPATRNTIADCVGKILGNHLVTKNCSQQIHARGSGSMSLKARFRHGSSKRLSWRAQNRAKFARNLFCGMEML
jgi:hypothetical protein